MIKTIEFPKAYDNSEALIAHIGFVQNKEELLKELYVKLNFPDYFGFNWDALYDCLSDFSWSSNYKIIIIHDYPLELDSISFSTYIQILLNAIENWKESEEHSLEVIFPNDETKKLVLSLQS